MAKVAIKVFTKTSEAQAWLEEFLNREDVKVFHILQSESYDNFDHEDQFSMTFTVVYAEEIRVKIDPDKLEKKLKEQAEENAKIDRAIEDAQHEEEQAGE